MVDWYFAYGSNMNPARMEARGLSFAQAIPGRLAGFRLSFNKRAVGKQGVAYANVTVCAQSEVQGVLYRLHNRSDICKMDSFEGSPVRYSRDAFAVDSPEGQLFAWLYVANRAMLAEDVLPERPYLDHLLAGHKHLSESYLKRISEHPCLERSSIGGEHSLLYNE